MDDPAPAELALGAVDCYVHANPDLPPRHGDDIALANELRDAGYRAAVHRHHFSSTVDRSIVASEATGFDLLGAVLLNDSVGGVNPAACELAPYSARDGSACRQLDEILTVPGVYVESTAYSMHPLGPSKGRNPAAVEDTAELIRHVGTDRCLLSSDGGMDDAPGPPALLGWALDRLARLGFDDAELGAISATNAAGPLAI